jgi:hypothetical protein
MRTVQIRFTLAALMLTTPLIALSGCGGGGGTASPAASSTRAGKLSLTVKWPEQTKDTRLIPQFTQVLRAELRSGDQVLGIRDILNEDGPPRASTVTFDNLQPGVVTLTATAYPEAGATGTPLASGAVSTTINSGETARVSITMASTIDRVEITPANPTTARGQRVILTATPFDAAGNVIIAPSSNFAWTSDNPNAVVPFPEGGQSVFADPLTIGTARLTVTESDSGKTASTTVTVVD